MQVSPPAGPEDQELVGRVKGGDVSAFELLMRRHNQRLYRVVRSVLGAGSEAEDAMQETYFSAFTHLGQFQGRAKFSTWLLKIGINEALGRVRRQGRVVALEDLPEDKRAMREPDEAVPTPEQHASNRQMGAIVEAALDRLPLEYRQVFVLRMVESLDTAETAAVLGLTEDNVKQRLHRARAMLQGHIETQVGNAAQSVFGFLGARCDSVVANVMARIAMHPRWKESS